MNGETGGGTVVERAASVTVGRFVYFEMDEHSCDEAFARGSNGYQPGELVAAQVVRVWGPHMVNLKLNLDGPQQLWVTSVHEGTGPRSWRWMYQGQAQNTTNQKP